MEQQRTHHFDNGDVVTGLCPNGQYGAYLEREDGRVRGYGHTRLAAIADLVEAACPSEPAPEIDRVAAMIER